MKFNILLLSLCILFFIPSAKAGSVLKVKDKKVFLKFSPEDSFTEGDLFTVSNANGKKIGLVLITKVKGQRAIGEIQKGRAIVGGATEFRGIDKKAAKKKKSIAKSDDDQAAEDEEEADRLSKKSQWGFLFGYGSATQDVTDLVSGDAFSMSGSSIAFKGAYDYPILETLALRGLLGAEMFSVSGNGPGTSTKIGTDVTYIVVDGLFKWDIYSGASMGFYAIGGMGIYYPLSKSSTAVATDTLESFIIGEVGAGIEIKMKGFTIPLEASYYHFPSGDTVKTSVISLKTGVLF